MCEKVVVYAASVLFANMPTPTVQLITITILSTVLPNLTTGAPAGGCCMSSCTSSCNNDLQAASQPCGNVAPVRPTVYPPSAVEYCDDDPVQEGNWDRSVEAAGARSPIGAVLEQQKILKEEGLPDTAGNAELYSFLLLRDGMKLLTGMFSE
ncbi:hypothetical protein pipiens_002467 [Culex pipiens pipiens]|uniref:Uncharacterized protein n=1 Tax=Culex pipiens pipiens TaxID=38569 RepID=A0ABD1DFQ8_CULPP